MMDISVKYRILIYGIGKWANILLNDLNMQHCEIVAFVQSKPQYEFYNGKKILLPEEIGTYEYDLLIVANNYADEVKTILSSLNIDHEKVLYMGFAVSDGNIGNRYAIIRALYCLNRKTFLWNILVKFIECKTMPVIELPDYVFLGNDLDYIARWMLINKKVYSVSEMDAFLRLSNRYYDCKVEGYFLDCGCNIATTSIYFLQQFTNLKAIGFEPIPSTYHIAKYNAILNGMENRLNIVNCGLSNCDDKMMMYYEKDNCGGSTIVNGKERDNDCLYQVDVTTVDNYLNINKISSDEISYIWVDVEGYEGFVLEGMENLLKQTNIPLMIEFSKHSLIEHGCLDKLLDILEKYFDGYIFVEPGSNEKLYPISNIRDIGDIYTNLFMVKYEK